MLLIVDGEKSRVQTALSVLSGERCNEVRGHFT